MQFGDTAGLETCATITREPLETGWQPVLLSSCTKSLCDAKLIHGKRLGSGTFANHSHTDGAFGCLSPRVGADYVICRDAWHYWCRDRAVLPFRFHAPIRYDVAGDCSGDGWGLILDRSSAGIQG